MQFYGDRIMSTDHPEPSKSPLLDLPTELRVQIYGDLLIPYSDLEPRQRSICHPSQSILPLLLTCRQIKEEAMYLLTDLTEMRFPNIRSVVDFTDQERASHDKRLSDDRLASYDSFLPKLKKLFIKGQHVTCDVEPSDSQGEGGAPCTYWFFNSQVDGETSWAGWVTRFHSLYRTTSAIYWIWPEDEDLPPSADTTRLMHRHGEEYTLSDVYLRGTRVEWRWYLATEPDKPCSRAEVVMGLRLNEMRKRSRLNVSPERVQEDHDVGTQQAATENAVGLS